MNEPKSISLIGAGGWGTALAQLLASSGRAVTIWAHDPAQVEEINTRHTNAQFLPGVTLAEGITATADMNNAAGADLLVVVPPSQFLKGVAEKMADAGVRPDTPLVCCTKGLEHHTGRLMTQVLSGALPSNPVAALSGPNHAEEVARGTPAAAVVAAGEPALASMLRKLFCTGAFRAYSSDDVAGVELGGALKNIYAIAAGISDGLGLGDNAKAALVTRSLAELVRLGTKLGGRRETFYGLSGLGDLMVTCFSVHSRNRGVGERLGRGEKLEDIRKSMVMVAEGVPTTRSAYEEARKQGVEAPLLDTVHAVLFEELSPREGLLRLLAREPKPENGP
ncbi:MAG: NAD(P)-dependent glycerol-3-phosphate dehydrogenase [Chthoniobacterales bacterium]|nr:NAD(P)-dependent glycerol-3-phosphate dehydrogenase [Chthoniobacterales bacterium]